MSPFLSPVHVFTGSLLHVIHTIMETPEKKRSLTCEVKKHYNMGHYLKMVCNWDDAALHVFSLGIRPVMLLSLVYQRARFKCGERD